MAEELAEESLRAEFHSQTARIPWQDLQPHYARGAVVLVAAELDLVEVALQLRLDNTERFQAWMVTGAVSGVSDEVGLQLAETNPHLWAVVVAPWVLVQRLPSSCPA
jgi:hypothetical protein